MILLIDVIIAVRTSLQLLLENEGYKTSTANGPAEALTFLKANTPELIILDLNFSIDTSGKEGMNLLQQIKKINEAVPIILITGWGSIELAVQGMKLGANDFLNKPWSNDFRSTVYKNAT
jgi:DNA-binding NtrC family response regulator